MLTVHRSQCLLPICNAPLLDWTFESLALAGVQEVFVICRSHADLVKKAVRSVLPNRIDAPVLTAPVTRNGRSQDPVRRSCPL